jgi:putative spermidine/putrescine transport system ATP-binding protein
MGFLELIHLTKRFENVTAVHDVNLSVERGEFVSLLGPSGCGKTTTLRMIAGFERPTVGRILLDGEDITALPPNRRHIGMVFQSYALFPHMTVAQNIAFGLQMRKLPSREIEERVRQMLALVHLEDLKDRYPHQLSGGQQQRVALARALAIEPRVLLLDEPLSALDAKIRMELRIEIRRVQRQLGITTIYVTHDQEEALSISDRVVVMNQGQIGQIGTPLEIYNSPQTPFVASFVGHLNLLPVDRLDMETGIAWVAGQPVRLSSPLQEKRAAMHLAIRPEELQLGAIEGYNCLRGRVSHVLFLGSVVRLQVDVGGSSLSIDLLNRRDQKWPHPGEPIAVSFAPHAAWLL